MRCNPGWGGHVRRGGDAWWGHTWGRGRHPWRRRRSRDGGMRNRCGRMRGWCGARRGSRGAAFLRRLRHGMGTQSKQNNDQDRCDRSTDSTHVFLAQSFVPDGFVTLITYSLHALLANAFESALFI
jgi:hypothetical protein